MLELYIPIVKSVVSMDNTACNDEPQPTGLRVAYKDDFRDSEGRFSEYGNENHPYRFDDVMWPEGCEMERTPLLRQPLGMNRGRGETRDEYLGLQNRDEINYRVMEYRGDQQYNDDRNQPCGKQQNRDEDFHGRDDWEVDRPAKSQRHQGRSDKCTEDAEDSSHDQNDHQHDRKSFDREPKESKALQSYGAMKKFTICELLKARNRNKKTKKAFQALSELKQSMGSRMNGSFFQRSGYGQARGQGHDDAAQDGGHDAFPHSGNASKAKGEYETFVLSLIPELKKLDDQQMRQFKWKVLQLIDDISAGSDSSGVPERRGGFSCQPPSGKKIDRFGSDLSGSGGQDEYQEHLGQDSLAAPVLMDTCGDKDEQWWDRDTPHQTFQQQRHPHQQQRQPYQQSKQPYRSQQQYQAHRQSWQQHRQSYEPNCEPQTSNQRYREPNPDCEPQLPHNSYNKPHRPHCEPQLLYQPRCEPQPPCQPHCEPPQSHQPHCEPYQPRHSHCEPPPFHQPHCEPYQPRHSHCEPPPPHQPHCEPQPPCQARCEPQPSCQPCCEPQQARHSKNSDAEHRPSETSKDSNHSESQSKRSSNQSNTSNHSEAQSKRSSRQSNTSNRSSRDGSPNRRVHYE